MCYSIDEPVKEKTFTGYKLVTRDAHGNLYSAFTGVRYEAGKTMKHPKKPGKYMSWLRTCPISTTSTNYNEKVIGRTAVFVNEAIARSYACCMIDCFDNLCLAKMTISDDLKDGLFSGNYIVSGKKIESVKFIETL